MVVSGSTPRGEAPGEVGAGYPEGGPGGLDGARAGSAARLGREPPPRARGAFGAGGRQWTSLYWKLKESLGGLVFPCFPRPGVSPGGRSVCPVVGLDQVPHFCFGRRSV